MNRIDAKFSELREAGRKGLVGYLTAGDPDIAASEKSIIAAVKNGVDVLELGMPFSDPTADGPTIQAAGKRALDAGMTVTKLLAMAGRIRHVSDVPIVLFGYANPFFSYGYERCCRDAAEAGVDGMLIVDLPFEEADELRCHLDKHDLYYVPLIAPTTGSERIGKVLEGARGFVYYIMVTGVTGAREQMATGLEDRVKTLKGLTDLPLAVGFGVSNGEQARLAAKKADAVVVGSALVKAAQAGTLESLVSELRSALDE